LVHILAPAGQDDEGVLATSVGLSTHSGCITQSGNGGSPDARLAGHCFDGVACLALQSDVGSLVLQVHQSDQAAGAVLSATTGLFCMMKLYGSEGKHQGRAYLACGCMGDNAWNHHQLRDMR